MDSKGGKIRQAVRGFLMGGGKPARKRGNKRTSNPKKRKKALERDSQKNGRNFLKKRMEKGGQCQKMEGGRGTGCPGKKTVE